MNIGINQNWESERLNMNTDMFLKELQEQSGQPCKKVLYHTASDLHTDVFVWVNEMIDTLNKGNNYSRYTLINQLLEKLGFPKKNDVAIKLLENFRNQEIIPIIEKNLPVQFTEMTEEEKKSVV